MNVILLTLGISLTLALVFLLGFLWAARKGQYDDLATPGQRILIDDFDGKKNASNNEEE